MRLYLSRRRNGLYQLTRLEPVVCELVGCGGMTDAFPRPGDPIVFGGLCPVGARLLVGRELEACEVARVVVTCSPVEQPPRS
jgi:hypothetical protein